MLHITTIHRRALRWLFLILGLVGSCISSSLAWGQTFNQIQFVIVTGDDDLRGDSSATATLLAANNSVLQTITLKSQSQSSWNNNTTHTVTATLNPARARAGIAHIMITLTSHNSAFETNDNWNINSVTATLSNGGAGSTVLVSSAGTPLTRLTGSSPSITLTPAASGGAGTFNEIQFVIGTGGDDLRGDSSATAKLLAPNGSTIQTVTLKTQNQGSWGNNTTHTVSAALSTPAPLFSIGSIVITLTSHNSTFETNDNWNIDNVVVTLSNNGNGKKQIMNASGNPFVRLTGNLPSISLPLPPVSLGTCGANCTNVATYHNDTMRTGWNSTERVLTPASVTPTSFGRIGVVAVDDQVDAQPLMIGNVLFVATENNTLYAFDFSGDSSTIRHFGPPVPQPLGCGNNGPNVGINSTPVVDVATRTLFVETYVMSGQPAHQMHALNLTTLAEHAGSPITVTATHGLQGGGTFSFNASYQRQRPALLLTNGNVYAGYGSFCDFGGSKSRGWLLGWKESSLAALPANQLNDRLTTGGAFLSSIWMSGYGVAADTSGILYFNTGNTGTYNSTFDLSESAVKVSGDLVNALSFFTPSNVGSLDGFDLDYGSGGLMVLPNQPGQFPRLAVGAGKDGRMFVLNRDSLGGFHPTDIPSNVQVGNCWCGPSYFEAGALANRQRNVVSSGGRSVKLWSPGVSGAGAQAVPTLNPVASADLSDASDQDGGFFTAVSSNGTTPNSAIIWALGRPVGTDHHITLFAFNATPSGATLPMLWSGQAGFWPNVGGNSNQVPTVANGHVFVASNRRLEIFGLRSGPPLPLPPIDPFPEAAITPPEPGARYWGTVKNVDGSRVVLELRTGAELTIDLSPALQKDSASEIQPGQPVMVHGKTNADGTVQADAVSRAKGKSLWGEDRAQ